MRSPYGLEISDNCLDCTLRSEKFFCNLPPRALQAFDSVTSPTSYPKDATLFVEGQTPRGVHLLCSGRVKLTMGSAEGKVLILRVAEPGDLLGLSATISGVPYELTAETMEPCQVSFVRRDDFLRFLRENTDACFRAAQTLSDRYDVACREIRSLGLSHSAAEKLAKLLLEWAARSASKDKTKTRVKIGVTHEEIAQMIGTSRETVTRILSELRKKQIIHLKGSTLEIRNHAALEALINS
ncbi:MAG: Crp/Fnr family transcriptional regulator [Terriglobales bacterium]